MLLVDTNVLVDTANADSPFHSQSHAFLTRQREDRAPWYATWPVIYEFLRVATHRKVLPTPWSATRAWEFVAATLLAAPGFSVLLPTPRHATVAEQTLKEFAGLSGNVMHDLHTAVLLREHGIRRIVTRDVDFHRFRFLEVVDPADA